MYLFLFSIILHTYFVFSAFWYLEDQTICCYSNWDEICREWGWVLHMNLWINTILNSLFSYSPALQWCIFCYVCFHHKLIVMPGIQVSDQSAVLYVFPAYIQNFYGAFCRLVPTPKVDELYLRTVKFSMYWVHPCFYIHYTHKNSSQQSKAELKSMVTKAVTE